jgi:hypothetical protein
MERDGIFCVLISLDRLLAKQSLSKFNTAPCSSIHSLGLKLKVLPDL